MAYINNYCSIEDAWGSLNPSVKVEKKKKKKHKDPIFDLYNINTNYNEVDMIKNINNSEEIVKSNYQKPRQSKRERSKRFITIDDSDSNFVDDMTLDKQFLNSIGNRSLVETNDIDKDKQLDLESHFNPLTIESDEEQSDSEHDYKEFKHLIDKKNNDREEEEDNDSDEEEFMKRIKRKGIIPFEDESYFSYKNPHIPSNNNYQDFTEDFVNEKKNSNQYLDIILYIISGIILIFVMEQFVKIGIILQ